MTLSSLLSALDRREKEGRLRDLPSETPSIDFASNDYFGFSKNLKFLDCIKHSPQVGATGSRLLTGNHCLFEELEQTIADFHLAESCLIFNSGYTANLGLISALSETQGSFIYDLDIHASLRDGMTLSKLPTTPFKHNDLDSLEQKLKRTTIFPAFVIVEALYSISGDLAPLNEMMALCQKYGAELIVDEAHSMGIFGANGQGLVYHEELTSQIFARVHTFSKVLGVAGGCVLGSAILKKFLVNFSRPFIYTTALPPPMLLLIGQAYQQLKKESPYLQQSLKRLWLHFAKLGFPHKQGPIQSLEFKALPPLKSLLQKLSQNRIDIRKILYPTVRKKKECLRVILHSFNTIEELNLLKEIIQ